MRMWLTAAAMVAGCWLGVLWPLLVLCAVAVVGMWRYRSLWLVWLVLGYGFGVWQLHQGVAQRLPAEHDRAVLSLQGQVRDIPVTRREFRFGRWQVRQQIHLTVWGSEAWPGTHRVVLNSYAPSVLLSAGDRVALDAELKVPRGVYNRFGPDRARADLAAGVDARGKFERVSVIANHGGVDAWREALSSQVAASVSGSPFGKAVLPALVVGDRAGLSSSLWRTFQLTGGAHLLAISGLHIAIVAGWFWWLGRALLAPVLQGVVPGLRRYSLQQLAWLPALLGAMGYAALAGFSLPTMRALVMLIVVALAQWWRVPVSLWRALGMALLVVLLITPLAALSASLWLSFGAVACIAMLTCSHAPWLLIEAGKPDSGSAVHLVGYPCGIAGDAAPAALVVGGCCHRGGIFRVGHDVAGESGRAVMAQAAVHARRYRPDGWGDVAADAIFAISSTFAAAFPAALVDAEAGNTGAGGVVTDGF